jgi:hypothetical protein
LNLPYTQDFEYLKVYNFTLRLSTDYGLPGLMPFSQVSVAVTWLGPPKGIYIDYKEVYSISSILRFELKNVGDWINQVNLQWSITASDATLKKVAASIDKSSAYINGVNQIIFSVARGAIKTTGDYLAVLTIYSTVFEDTVVYQSEN